VLGSDSTIVVRRAGERFVTSAPGRTTWHVFSFGEHYDPDRIGFGPLMVCNTELLQTDHGYPDHPHRDTEIVSWVLDGSLRHSDSAGNTGIIHPGLAQRMSAGSGIVHAELNDAYRLDPDRPAQPVSFVQLWIRPDEPGTTPGYAQRELLAADLAAGLVPVVSGSHPDAAIGIGTRDATLWVSRPATGVALRLPEASAMFLVVARGEIELDRAGRLASGDSAELADCGGIVAIASTDAELLIMDVAR
jgi:redox-sensitive bicupin YhaK (pirin superfamily)